MKFNFEDALENLGYSIPENGVLELPKNVCYDPVIGCLTNKDTAQALTVSESTSYLLELAGIEQRENLSNDFLTPSEIKEIPINWLIKDILIAGQAGLIVAPPKSMKSFFTLALAVAVATGRDFAGHETKKAGVLYFANENTPTDDAPRLRMMGAQDAPNLWINYKKTFKIEQIEDYEDIIRARNVKLVIIDPLYLSITGGNEALKDENKMTQILIKLGEFKRKMEDVTFVIVHHTKKIEPRREQQKDFTVSENDIFGTNFINAWREFLFLITKKDQHSEIELSARSFFTEEKLACRVNNFGFEVISFKPPKLTKGK